LAEQTSSWLVVVLISGQMHSLRICILQILSIWKIGNFYESCNGRDGLRNNQIRGGPWKNM